MAATNVTTITDRIAGEQSNPGFLRRQLKINIKMGWLCMYAMVIIFTYVYYNHVVPHKGDLLMYRMPTVDVGGRLKCVVPYGNCEHDLITGWSLIRLVMFGVIGAYMPDNYITVLVYGAITESTALASRGRPRYISNTLVNTAGYAIGSNFRQLLMPFPVKRSLAASI